MADEWFNISCLEGMAPWKFQVRQFRNLPPEVRKIRVLLSGIFRPITYVNQIVAAIRRLQKRGVVVEVIGYHRVSGNSISILQAATPGHRVMLAGMPLSFKFLSLSQKEGEGVPFRRLLVDNLAKTPPARKSAMKAAVRDVLKVVRAYEAGLLELMPGIPRHTLRRWGVTPYVSPEVARVRNNKFTQLMDDHRYGWKITMMGSPCVLINGDLLKFKLVDRVSTWGEAFEDEAYFAMQKWG